jgi:hypothetical protein
MSKIPHKECSFLRLKRKKLQVASCDQTSRVVLPKHIGKKLKGSVIKSSSVK